MEPTDLPAYILWGKEGCHEAALEGNMGDIIERFGWPPSYDSWDDYDPSPREDDDEADTR